jgi:hypothetical protein
MASGAAEDKVNDDGGEFAMTQQCEVRVRLPTKV